MTTPTPAIEAVAKAICARMNNGYCDNVGVTHGCKIGRGWHNESDCRMTAEAMGLTKENDIATAVHLPPTAVAALAGHPNISKASGRLFSLIAGSGLYKPLRKAWKAAGLEAGGQPLHILRHTWGTWMRRYGKIDDIGLLQTGAWADPKSVRRYAHAVVSEESRRADLLPIRGEFGGNAVKALK